MLRTRPGGVRAPASEVAAADAVVARGDLAHQADGEPDGELGPSSGVGTRHR
jgi:hypothetical protein